MSHYFDLSAWQEQQNARKQASKGGQGGSKKQRVGKNISSWT